MALLQLKEIYYSVGQFPLMDKTSLTIQANERLALIGRNGEGKSTLFKILDGTIQAESGEIIKPNYFKIARLMQELPDLNEMTVYEFVAHGLEDISQILIDYHHHILHPTSDESWLKKLDKLQDEIEQRNGWEIQRKIEQIMQALNLPEDKLMSELSGGWRRRVALAQALVQEPDILLLDEPTNHLDLEAIEWLEKLLLNYSKTIIFITHDRALLRKIATGIVELDRGRLTQYPPDYDEYLSRKAQTLMEEERHNALFDKKLSLEEQWIRTGVKARRTRNEGRVRALKALREERKKRRTQVGKIKLEATQSQGAGKMVIQAENVSFGYSDKKLIKDFTFNIQRGDKISIVGANGSGKTTLIKLLLGELAPQSGTIKHSPTNQIAFFDQNRQQLVGEETLVDNVAQGDDFVEINGKRKHIISYLGDFLFSPQKARGLVKTLSGGEQNRLMLARLFSRPANVLVLDEPTNDLDIESLEMLEDLLLHYEGTVIIISHDREFIDNIATHCIAFDNEGNLSVQVGGYSDWLAYQANKSLKNTQDKLSKMVSKDKPARDKDKLSYHEQKELESLPSQIDTLEKEIQQIQHQMANPDFYSQDSKIVQEKIDNLKESQSALEKAYARWETLDNQ